MPYCPDSLRTQAFMAGEVELYNELYFNPELRMVRISQLAPIQQALKRLGYQARIRYRGPHGRLRDTLKRNARAFTVYIQE